MIEAVVFDFDGVLADSEPCHLRALTRVLETLGIPLTADEYYSRYLGLDDEGAFRAVTAAHGVRLDERAIADLIEQKARVFDEIVAGGSVLFPGARSCVERLARDFPLGIASGALRHEIENVLEASALRQHFTFIVAAGETPRGKPYPDPYLRAAELHGRHPEACVAIEDSRWGIEAARTAGLACVGITNTYGSDNLPGASRVIGSLDDFTTELIRSL